jgi:tRNA1Val (adenine37-N6)-methyltransferase
MSNPYFRFKQFTVWHDKCAMKVNTDGVLLGAWANVNDCLNILDVGAGTGIISLMLAQRAPWATIDGVEIEEKAFRQAEANIGLSDWSQRIALYHSDFKDFYGNTPRTYDLIVSNPPYFSNSLHNPKAEKRIARHSESLPFEVLLQGADKLLGPNGVFSIILPAENSEFENQAFVWGLRCKRRMLVRSLPHKEVFRQMLEFSREPEQPVSTEELNIYKEPGVFSDQYKELTKDFYLNF